jgi:hypothetical protein
MVKEQTVEVLVTKFGLGQALLGEDSTRPAPDVDPPNQASDDIQRLTIDARLKRCGRELRLVVAGESSDDAPRRPPVPALIKVIARALSWYERMISGEVKSQKLIADEMKLEECYVSRVIQCAFLAPDIVEAILEGSQPADLTLEKLLSGLPADWDGQRRRLGFSQGRSRTRPFANS